ncbi:unnamed protein product [Ectocarpus sp. 4 AP-2014]
MSEGEAYDPAAAAVPAGSRGDGGGRGRGRGRGRGGGGVAIAGIAELDASMGRGAPVPPAGGGGKPLPKKEQKDFRGPAGLFKKGDWTCTACGNVNWERRATCNKCNNPKPNLAATDEAREGLGGGFNERQDRASVATVEVDEDGFDDFGRKKIKARADKKAKEDAALARLRKSFGGGILGGTSLAPVGKPPVPGQFDDPSPAPSVTTYDKFGRPRLAGGGRNGGGDNGASVAAAAASGGDRNGREGDHRDRDRDRRDSRDKDRRRGARSRSRSRSRERSSRDKDRSRRRRSRSRSRDHDRRR